MSAFTPMGVEALVKGLSKFKSDLGEMGSAAEGAGSKMEALGSAGLALGSALGTIAFAAAAAGAAALAGGLAMSIKEALAAEEVWTRLGAVITAMGENSTITGDEAQALGMQFRDLAGGSDEAVAEIIQMGLQMGTVSEEQMPAFIQTALDLAAVTGKDVVMGARLMAQALDDPVGAMQRFSRQGLKVERPPRSKSRTLSRPAMWREVMPFSWTASPKPPRVQPRSWPEHSPGRWRS